MSITIFILVYFIILSTFCAGRKSIERDFEEPYDVDPVQEESGDTKSSSPRTLGKVTDSEDQAFKFIQELIRRKNLKVQAENK